MIKLVEVLFFAISLIVSRGAAAWGNDGHKTIGAIADRLIAGTNAETAVLALLLPGESLESISIWADCAKGYCGPLTPEMKSFVTANPDHHDYHFTDLPFESNVYQDDAVGTTGQDVVHILRQCIAVLRGDTSLAANPHGLTPRQALLLITHLIGDLHQPLHVGTAYMNLQDTYTVPATSADIDEASIFATLGDNYLLRGATPLHGYWDSKVVKSAMTSAHVTTPGTYANYLIGKGVAGVVPDLDVMEWPAQWATETLLLSKRAHKGVIPQAHQTVQDRHGQSHLAWPVLTPKNYPTLAKTTAGDQLSRAGKRLAALLQAIWP